MKNWIRARNQNQIDEREEAILTAALQVFKKVGYEQTNLSGIAQSAGFTRSNLYRYFQSREEIFLAVYSEHLKKWSEELQKTLLKLPPRVALSKFADHWIASLLNHKTLLDLSPLLFISLERNSSREQLIAFKKTANELVAEQAEGLVRIYPSLTWEKTRQFLLYSHGLIVSLWPASNPNAVLSKLYKQAEFKALKVDFVNDTKAGLVALLRGLLPEMKESK